MEKSDCWMGVVRLSFAFGSAANEDIIAQDVLRGEEDLIAL